MANNESLKRAKKEKDDEFYTEYSDIEKEMNAYLEYNPNVFKNKTILLPCDDPEWSNFTRYFAQNFELLGLKKLISTSYANDKKSAVFVQLSLFEQESPKFDKNKTNSHGKIFTLDRDTNKSGRIDINDLEWDYLKGDGDFRSEEVTKLRDEADIIITNPPFSLFREFFKWLIESKKKFLCICNKNILSAKDVFPYVMRNEVWGGSTRASQDLLFDVPKEIADYYVKHEKEGSKYKIVDGKVMGRSASIWLTNMEHGIRHQKLDLMSMADNLKFCTHKDLKGLKDYWHYENYDAIEVPSYKSIPDDYDGVMGVPISFLGYYCPEQFEILGISLELADMKIIKEKLGKLNGGPRLYIEQDGQLKRMYERILIRKRH